MDPVSVDTASAAASTDWSFVACLCQLGGGGIAGMAVGYAMKFAFKMALLALGSFLIMLYLMCDSGFITINWAAVAGGIENGTRAAGSWALDMVTQMSSAFAGFAGGAYLGWKFK